MGVVVDGDPLGKDPFVFPADKEALLPRDRGSGHRTDEMADETAPNTRIEDNGHCAARELGRSEPRYRAFTGAPAEQLGIVEFLVMPYAVAVIVALHLAAGPGDHAR